MAVHRLRQAVGGALILAALAFVSSCSGNKASESPGPPAWMMGAVPVTMAPVTQKTVPVELKAIGNAETYAGVSVKSQVDGQLGRAYFHEGQDVKQGNLLFTIDARPFEATLRQAEANLAKDTAQAKHANSDAEKFLKLADAGIASREQYDESRTNAEALDAAARADKAAVENAQVQLGYCTIRSPIDGRTGSLLVHPGNLVKANDATLVVINQIRPIYVNFAVPEAYLPEVKQRMAAGSLRVRATVAGEENHPQEGVLTFVDNSVDVATGTIHLKGTFPNPEKRLWPGQFVNVSLTLSERTNAVVAPSQAVQTGQMGQYVFVVKPDFTADIRPVTAGPAAGGDTVIEKGLQPGEKVITDGQLRLYPGAKVEEKKQ